MKTTLLKLKFHGPKTTIVASREQGHETVTLTTPMLDLPEAKSAEIVRRVYELEQSFNELTQGRLHVDLVEDKAA